MKYFKFYKLKNNSRDYFLDERQLREAFAIFLHGYNRHDTETPTPQLIARFISHAEGLDANYDGRSEDKIYECLDPVVRHYRRGEYNYLWEKQLPSRIK